MAAASAFRPYRLRIETTGGRSVNHTGDDTVQVQRRWPWFAAGALLLLAGALAAWSVYLLWLPCQGSMLDGTVLGPKESPDITDACLRRMDEGFPFMYFAEDVGQTPSASQIGGVAMVLAAASWIVLVLGLRLSWGTRCSALIAGVAPTVLALVSLSAALNPGPDIDALISGWLWISVDAVAFVVFMVVAMARSDLGVDILPGMAIVLCGATVFGFAHPILDYATMITFNEYNWDTPPGTGWISVAVLVIAGSASVVYGLRRRDARVVEPSMSRFA